VADVKQELVVHFEELAHVCAEAIEAASNKGPHR
jgi:hypothetical protein